MWPPAATFLRVVGVVPLFIASGAGSGSQNAIGTSVLGGVVSATLLGIFFIPMFYVWVRSMFPYMNNEAHDVVGNNGYTISNSSDFIHFLFLNK